MKKHIIISTLLSSIIVTNGFALDYKGNFGIEASYLNHDEENKRDKEGALRLEFELQQKLPKGKAVINLKKVYDLRDEERRYFDFSDFYYKHNFENSDLLIGRNTRFWGAMEFYNHTDVFNTKDWLDNPFDYDSKIGANNVAYTHYFDNSELSIIAKVRESRQEVQDSKSVNNFYPPNYDDDLETQEGRDRPTVYLKYTASAEEMQLDYSLIYQDGYDEQRYLAPVGTKLKQHAYLVNKIMGYATLVQGETIYKTELAYTKSDDDLVSDYAQASVGLEHTLYGIWDKRDLGLLLEYYKYKASEDEGDRSSQNLFNDDIALGFRLSMNDSASSELLGGIAIDRDTKEQMISIEYNTRLLDKYKLELSYQHLEPKEDSSFQKMDRAMVEVGYYF